MRYMVILAVAFTAAAVACSDSTGPEVEPYPDVAGSYAFQGDLDDPFCFNDAIRGTLTLTQESRSESSLGGTADLATTLCDNVLPLNQLMDASVTQDGQIGFRLMRPEGESVWAFEGEIEGAGNSLSGTWQIVGGTSSGTWVAHR